MSLQFTGGYSSDLNDNIEILNKLVKRMSGAFLANAGLPLKYWCYGVIHTSRLLNYLSYNYDKSMAAYEA